MLIRRFAAALLLASCVLSPVSGAEAWRQWGGPRGDFTVEDEGLATAWPEDGPELLWDRQIGEGYSAILVEADRLYTMYHRGDEEVVLAADARTGRTIWETAYAAPAVEGMNLQYGPGPHATPALAGDRLFTIGSTDKLYAFDKSTGKILWSHDLIAELGAPLMPRGFGASPLVVDDLVIVTPGGEGSAVTAFRQRDGEIAWSTQSYRPSYSSPILAEVAGEEQVIVAMGPDRAGLDPKTGAVRWHLALDPRSATIMSTQLWDADDELLIGSAAYADGSRAIRVEKTPEGFAAEELWFSRKMRIQYGNAIRLGDRIYGSSGDFGPALLVALDAATGEVLFRERGFAKANLLAVSGKLLILDEDGVLSFATPGAEGLEIHARAGILDEPAWTVPTLVGTRLYVRNRERMRAYELGS